MRRKENSYTIGRNIKHRHGKQYRGLSKKPKNMY
jgi:hypothetical protein